MSPKALNLPNVTQKTSIQTYTCMTYMPFISHRYKFGVFHDIRKNLGYLCQNVKFRIFSGTKKIRTHFETFYDINPEEKKVRQLSLLIPFIKHHEMNYYATHIISLALPYASN